MNEITRIHLGRQPYTIAVDAHTMLKTYIAAIRKEVSDTEVMDEIELRMAELLSNRGVNADKVILLADVQYLQAQLGDPSDFSDNESTVTDNPPKADAPVKRLFRDTDHALLAGVSAGLANYFGIDAVIVRILFVVVTLFSGGAGIFVYIVLWLLIPAAETSSEKLQMHGLPVTVDALKKTISSADLSGTARRANNTFLRGVDIAFRVALKLAGIAIVIAGMAAIFMLVIVKVYMLMHHGQLFEENLFPVGERENWLANTGLIFGSLVSIFAVLVGLTIIRRKWPIRAWATIPLLSVLAVTFVAVAALSADVGPRVQARYQAGMHTTAIKDIAPFDSVNSDGKVDIEYVPATASSVSLRYYGNPDISKIKFSVANNVLTIDTHRFDQNRHCDMLCLFPRYNLVVQVATPNLKNIDANGAEIFYPPVPAR